MSKSLHILFTAAWYPNRMNKGDGVFVEKHASAISLKHNVSVLLVKADPLVSNKYEIETEKKENLTIYRIYVPKVKSEIPLFSGVLRFLYFIRGSVAGYKLIVKEKGKVDISHINVLTRAGLIPYFLKKVNKIPYIITEHWSRYARSEYPANFIHKKITEQIVKNAAFVAPVSNNLKNALINKNLNNDNFAIISNVVNTDIFKVKHLSETRKSNKVVFTHVSWMRDDSKNISGIIEVIKQLSLVRNDFTLRLIGEGIDKDKFVAKTKELGLEDFITFTGPKSGDSLASELRNSDFFILFSNYENQPVCILEALSSGIPVISTKVGMLEELIDKNKGILIEPKDKKALLNSILFMMDNFSNYKSEELHNYVEANFSPDIILERYNSLYFAAMNKEII